MKSYSPMTIAPPEWIVANCVAQLRQLYDTQTAPFVTPFADYCAGLQRARELEVRLVQLDKEGAELRDETAELHSRLAAVDLAAAANTAAQLEEARAALSRAERELGSLYRDKANLLEEVVGANTSLTTARSALESSNTQLAQSRAEVAALREQLSGLGASLELERAARVAATAELAAAMSARDGALVEAERLRHENTTLLRRLMEMKEGEAGRLNDLNRMHEELLEQAARMKQEAELDRQATELIRQRAVAAALSGVAAGALGQPPSVASSVLVAAPPLATAPAGAGGGGTTGTGASSGEWVGAVGAAQPGSGGLQVPMSLREVMGMLAGSPSQRGGGGGGGDGVGTAGLYGTVLRPPELRMPARVPVAVVSVAHKGGCNSLAPQSPGGGGGLRSSPAGLGRHLRPPPPHPHRPHGPCDGGGAVPPGLQTGCQCQRGSVLQAVGSLPGLLRPLGALRQNAPVPRTQYGRKHGCYGSLGWQCAVVGRTAVPRRECHASGRAPRPNSPRRLSGGAAVKRLRTDAGHSRRQFTAVGLPRRDHYEAVEAAGLLAGHLWRHRPTPLPPGHLSGWSAAGGGCGGRQRVGLGPSYRGGGSRGWSRTEAASRRSGRVSGPPGLGGGDRLLYRYDRPPQRR
ncbi:hypothetical protein Vretimale_7522 [Volvox reticuliferus]|uniref:Autophagy-related protein 16 domain-containing protein n=1 Tax=Volvox reticuliferus TaxID=1737510 RepID=A0A8J4G9I5_9CHLO|nr:hypothetical protein Vretimale_7522 [Volvox reticuliferus]